MINSAVLPKFIRFRDAPNYLGMDRNRFNVEVRPYIGEIPIGKQGVAFDRIDLDQWAEHYKQCVVRPSNLRGELWHENDKNQKRQDCSNAETLGTLTKKSLDDEYERLLGPLPTKRPRPSWRAVSKTQGRQ